MMTYASCTAIANPNYAGELGGAAAAGGGVAGGFALPPRILNITVPQVGHLPLIALRPFFISSSTASTISFFALHLTQYPSAIKSPEKKTRLQRRVNVVIAYGAAVESVNCENRPRGCA